MLRKSSMRSKAEEARSMSRGSKSGEWRFWRCSKIRPATPWDLLKCKTASRGFLKMSGLPLVQSPCGATFPPLRGGVALQSIPPLLHRHQDWTAFVLEHDDQEFCRLGFACIPPHDMNIVGPLIERLARRQRDFFSSFHLHDDGAFEHVDKRVRIVPVHRV